MTMGWVKMIKQVFNYLANLEWTEHVQSTCIFCDRANFNTIVFEDDSVIAIENLHLGGQFHWLIMPKAHGIRDIEALSHQHLALLKEMDQVKKHLVDKYCSGIPDSAIISGYHRGRRPLVGKVYYPDIISIHHLHLHVIVKPRWILRLFKYPAWLPLMWKSDVTVMREVQRLV
ncbi:hypothetical protein GGS24DRAFT_468533 [Hypoxylon argillaceum]|nr:hypothetical protein GGS24DRAFT_468533 [Hypoxylon argillaceum]